ncbi:hypothetical protein [Hydrogenovibrio sp. JE_KL2]|jgi:hypothetical protein|uniref:hypothetical protein n=1 Tax=Hydrogenovibrio sp. JE_KL2 TaxID=2651188 RepID=UPI00128CDDA0|nr:hypothetical protein [Hydrogenovibrio sp. JE_KL2]MBD3821591.1 hypothetical protein [Thiotrichales bacterium]MBN2606571.1 hypothetical protein [Thiotrichales bacterium]MPQ76034.1 hypothetical protein [Hydrogenovibrio sp. JE_KL2]
MDVSSIGSATQNSIQGMQKGFEQLDQASKDIANPNQPDKASGLVQTKFSETQVEASTKSLKAADDRIGTLLDIMA